MQHSPGFAVLADTHLHAIGIAIGFGTDIADQRISETTVATSILSQVNDNTGRPAEPDLRKGAPEKNCKLIPEGSFHSIEFNQCNITLNELQ